MTTEEFVSLGRRLQPDFPDFAIRRRLFFISPLEHTLRGFNFDPSGFDKTRFYINAFYLPLCIPRKNLSYTFGKRLKGTGWHADAPNLEIELVNAMQRETPFLISLRTPKDVVEDAKLRAWDSKDPHKREVVAYMLARAGEVAEAVVALDRLLSVLDPDIPWQHEMADRALALNSQLVDAPAAAQRQLDVWEAETVKNLGLEEFWRVPAT
jgi:hypothetical protein